MISFGSGKFSRNSFKRHSAKEAVAFLKECRTVFSVNCTDDIRDGMVFTVYSALPINRTLCENTLAEIVPMYVDYKVINWSLLGRRSWRG
jgi:hypothetical protein